MSNLIFCSARNSRRPAGKLGHVTGSITRLSTPTMRQRDARSRGFLAYRARPNKFTAGEDSKLPYRWISGHARNWARGPTERERERRWIVSFPPLSLRSDVETDSTVLYTISRTQMRTMMCVCVWTYMERFAHSWLAYIRTYVRTQ